MLTICSLNDFESHESDYNFLIVASMLYKVPNVTQFEGLAPSLELFTETLRQKKINENWFERFSQEFRKEMKSPKYLASRAMIQELLNEGSDVTLMCYCKDFNKCHRSLVAEDFKNLGYKVLLK